MNHVNHALEMFALVALGILVWELVIWYVTKLDRQGEKENRHGR